jgi:hypothetical protein
MEFVYRNFPEGAVFHWPHRIIYLFGQTKKAGADAPAINLLIQWLQTLFAAILQKKNFRTRTSLQTVAAAY